MTLGDFVHSYRTEHNMNMQDFANKCGLSKAYISILERNLNPSSGRPPIPSLETIRAIANAVGIHFNDIIAALDGEQIVSLETSLDEIQSKDFFSKTEVDLIHAYRKATPDDQGAVDLILKKYKAAPSKLKRA